MPEAVNGTGEGQPADDIRSALAAAIASSENEAAMAAEPKPAKAANGAAEIGLAEGTAAGAADAGEGAPVATDEKPKKPEAAAAEPADAEKAATEKGEVEKKTAGELTGKWSAKDKETFKTLPAEGQELILRRHKEMEAAFTRKTQDIAAFRKEYEPVDEIFKPYRDKMKSGGWTPHKLIEGWANVEKRLMEGDGVGVIAGLINGYKIDLGKVAQALGLRPVAAPSSAATREGEPLPAPAAAAASQLPPEVIQQLTELRARVDARDQADLAAVRRAQTSAEQRVMTDIEKFKSAQDDKGNLLHPHFDDLEEDMTQLAAAAIAAKKPVPSLQDLYEKAAWANPSTRDATLAARDKAQREKAADEARAKAAAAKKAGSSVTGAPGSGQAPQTTRRAERSLREELETAAEEASV